jgi:hypothetical protein
MAPTMGKLAIQIILAVLVVALLYAALAYLLLPGLWSHYEHQHKLAGMRMLTTTAQGIPGDPINIGLVGSDSELRCAMKAAGWSEALPLSLRSDIGIAASVLLDRPDKTAPVSTLLFNGRRQDLAFEKTAAQSADRRHHVRFWLTLAEGAEGRPVWLGAGSFDKGIGVSRYTGALTHHIDPDIDAERDAIASDLEKAGMVTATYQISGIGPTWSGKNGEGDAYFTDGEIRMLRLTLGCARYDGAVETLANPMAIDIKDAVWDSVVNAVKRSSAASSP